MMESDSIIIFFALNNSGHHTAAMALEKAFSTLYPNKIIIVLNVLESLSPALEKVMSFLYRLSSYTFPWAWGLLYNNFLIYKLLRPLRNSINKFTANKLKIVLEKARPSCIICTQAIPVGIAGYLKSKYNFPATIIAVMTDYFPNIYWINKYVNYYVVASPEMIDLVSSLGVSKNKIVALGIPIHPVFSQFDRYEEKRQTMPHVLILGGGRGWGDVANFIKQLDMIVREFRLTVVCGTNLKLLKYLKQRNGKFKKRISIFGQISPEKIKSLLDTSSLIISKAGGLTIAEALARGVPMVIVNSSLGQESKNSSFLIKNEAAVQAKISTIADTIENLFINPADLKRLKNNASKLSRPLASFEIVNFARGLCN
jgi:processive 1,2-diacylglycerol beta-glucosyltransferase